LPYLRGGRIYVLFLLQAGIAPRRLFDADKVSSIIKRSNKEHFVMNNDSAPAREMVICKACGFIMEKGKVKDLCPACGVKAAMFIPHDERISPRRKFLLSLDLHPVLVHFPQAFYATILVLALVALFVNGTTATAVRATLYIIGLALPAAVLAAFAAGIMDGKIRFRRVTTPILKTKIILGILLFITSIIIAVVARTAPQATNAMLIVLCLISVGGIAVSALLALLGVSLLHARFPG
jgi:uncharacterized membrane protein